MKRWLPRSVIATLAVSLTLALPSAQQTPDRPEIEVAALRITAPTGFPSSPLGLGRWSASALTLTHLLGYSFELRPMVQPIVGLPEWASREFYSIAVKADDGMLLTREAMRPRMKRFLEERCDPGLTESASPSLFTALQEQQLGLRLISRNGIPVHALVIDHVEHPTVD